MVDITAVSSVSSCCYFAFNFRKPSLQREKGWLGTIITRSFPSKPILDLAVMRKPYKLNPQNIQMKEMLYFSNFWKQSGSDLLSKIAIHQNGSNLKVCRKLHYKTKDFFFKKIVSKMQCCRRCREKMLPKMLHKDSPALTSLKVRQLAKEKETSGRRDEENRHWTSWAGK